MPDNSPHISVRLRASETEILDRLVAEGHARCRSHAARIGIVLAGKAGKRALAAAAQASHYPMGAKAHED